MKKFLQQCVLFSFVGIIVIGLSLFAPTPTAYAKGTSGKKQTPYPAASIQPAKSTSTTNPVRAASLNMRSLKLVKGKTAHLRVLNLPTNYTVSYQSTNSKIATVSSDGTIYGKKNGNASIIASLKYNNKTVRKLTCSVEVGPAAVSIVIPKSQLTLTVGKSTTLAYILKPSNCVELPTFKSSNKKIVTITKSGVIKTHAVGRATITATISNKKSDSITIIVKKPKKNKK